MTRIQQVSRSQRSARPDRRPLLADDEMNRRLHLVLVIPPFDLFFDATDAQHRKEQVSKKLRRVRSPEALESFRSFASVSITNAHGSFTIHRVDRAQFGFLTCRSEKAHR